MTKKLAAPLFKRLEQADAPAAGTAPKPGRRALLIGAGSAALLSTVARAQNMFPERPVTIIVPWPAGSTSDGLMRALTRAAAPHLNQTIVVENRPGAASLLGTQAIAAARPDGYTIGQVTSSAARFQQLGLTSPDPRKDLTLIVRLAGFTFGTVVRADSPHRTMRDVIGFAKANPGKLTYATAGVGSQVHIGMEMILRAAGVTMLHVPYKGGNEAMQALLSGDVDMMADSSGWLPMVESGRLRLTSVWGEQRLARFPDVPTLRDLGYDLAFTSPFGVAGPAGIPEKARTRLAQVFEQAAKSAEFKEALDRLLMPTMYQGPAEYADYMVKSYDEETKVVETLKLRELLK
jgi:tripartite-type tricarboxylate transporter receptor subunit TctC